LNDRSAAVSEVAEAFGPTPELPPEAGLRSPKIWGDVRHASKFRRKLEAFVVVLLEWLKKIRDIVSSIRAGHLKIAARDCGRNCALETPTFVLSRSLVCASAA
jgi:hypothetical protein